MGVSISVFRANLIRIPLDRASTSVFRFSFGASTSVSVFRCVRKYIGGTLLVTPRQASRPCEQCYVIVTSWEPDVCLGLCFHHFFGNLTAMFVDSKHLKIQTAQINFCQNIVGSNYCRLQLLSAPTIVGSNYCQRTGVLRN